MNRAAKVCGGWLLLVLTGCGSGLSAVSGTVTLPDGQTKAGISVSFSDLERHIGARGVTDENGRYELYTNAPGDGAPPGKYLVAVVQPGPANSSQPEGPRLFPTRYENGTTSGLTFEVKPGRNTFDIRLEKQ